MPDIEDNIIYNDLDDHYVDNSLQHYLYSDILPELKHQGVLSKNSYAFRAHQATFDCLKAVSGPQDENSHIILYNHLYLSGNENLHG